ncbi:oxidoreductase [Saccharothrix texasensis]|uniref:oxidoreductase n=1 Tax=Saccharothrix texasensis TaxID=103734 RepID=UPI000F4C4AA2|nr:oxidoreductase [Saccharothrix texasensis]
MSSAVPAALCLLALTDACFAGFRASTGRNARIHKRAYYLRAAWRGLLGGAVGLAAVALLLLLPLVAAPDAAARYAELVRAGTRLLEVLVPFAALVVATLVAYWLLPMRESTFVILVGLGPFTLLRPVVVVAGAVWAAVGSSDWLVWAGSGAAAACVLAVEPAVHRLRYASPT